MSPTCPRSRVTFTSLNSVLRDRGGLCHQRSVPSTALEMGWARSLSPWLQMSQCCPWEDRDVYIWLFSWAYKVTVITLLTETSLCPVSNIKGRTWDLAVHSSAVSTTFTPRRDAPSLQFTLGIQFKAPCRVSHARLRFFPTSLHFVLFQLCWYH